MAPPSPAGFSVEDGAGQFEDAEPAAARSVGRMLSFAWRNLLTRPLRTVLALVGLSIPILGVLGLFSLSGGLRNLIGDTLSQIEGVMVLRENAPSPVFSSVPPDLPGRIRELPGVRVAAPEVWGIAPEVEGTGFIVKAIGGILTRKNEDAAQGILDAIVIQGQDIPTHAELQSAVYPRKLLPPDQGGGRFLKPGDEGKNRVVVSKKIADEYKKKVGDPIRIGIEAFEIIGIYETGSMFLDVVLVMDIDVARRTLKEDESKVSSVYVEADDPGQIEAVAARIEAAAPGIDARSMQEFSANFGRILGELDTFLMMIVSLALLVGVVGIINTMLMSTTERFTEFGVLRTNGWSRANLLTLVTAESAYLGLLAGILGCLLALAGTAVGNQFIEGGLKLTVTPAQIALGLGLSVVMGTLGGLYPAWRASRLVPMDAIRLGAH